MLYPGRFILVESVLQIFTMLVDCLLEAFVIHLIQSHCVHCEFQHDPDLLCKIFLKDSRCSFSSVLFWSLSKEICFIITLKLYRAQGKPFSRLTTLCTHLVWMRVASLATLYTTSGYVMRCIIQNFTVGYKSFVHAPESFTVGYKSFVHAPEAFTVGYKILYMSVARIRWKI